MVDENPRGVVQKAERTHRASEAMLNFFQNRFQVVGDRFLPLPMS
jgi:hypothetical protein